MSPRPTARSEFINLARSSAKATDVEVRSKLSRLVVFFKPKTNKLLLLNEVQKINELK